jgi:hypothetical protein
LVDPNSELGCVDSAADAALCDYHANNDCTSIVELPCDGPEDCAPGNVCCGRTQRDHYDLFGCFLSCDGIVDGQDGVWIEICHPGAPCLNPRFTCEASALLPGFLARCHDRGTPVLPDGGGLSLDASIDGDAGDAPVARDASTAADASVPPPPPGIACGSTNCAASEKCCLRRHVGASSGAASIDPYCTKADGFCACSPAVDP